MNLFVHFKESTKIILFQLLMNMIIFRNYLWKWYKKISYSQYGYHLHKNKTFSSTLIKYLKPALSVEISWGIDKILEMYNFKFKDSLGIFITQSNKYRGFINLNSLLTLSYKRNIEIATNQNPLTKLPGIIK